MGGTPSQVWCGGGYPIPGLGWGGGYSSQVWMVTPEVPRPWGWGGYPGHVWMVRGYPSHVLMVGVGTPAMSGWWGWGTLARSGWWGVPHSWGGDTPAMSGWWGGVTWPGLDGGGYPGHVWMEGYPGYPLARSGWWRGTQGTPHYTEQYSEHLLRGGRHASCVHAGGLSCSIVY